MVGSTFERLADLPLTVQGYALRPHALQVSDAFARLTTTVRLRGSREHFGAGEEVSYGQTEQELLRARGACHDLAGEWTLASFSQHLEGLQLFAEPPQQTANRDYRRWAFESAALDLALRTVGKTLGEVLELEPRPLRFVASLGLGSPPTTEPLDALRAADPTLRFKLDATDAWDDALVERLAATGSVATIDLKGAYRGTPVDQAPNRDLYERVVRGFPDAWIEDPGRSDETDDVLEGHWERVTWDAPIHSVADVLELEYEPRVLNVKPSRFGTLERLFDFYDHCARHGIGLYGGGQFELSEGRRQIQLLASLFHPDADNDVAPRSYHAPAGRILETSPLEPSAFGAHGVGFAPAS